MTTEFEQPLPVPPVHNRLVAAGWRRGATSGCFDEKRGHDAAVIYTRDGLEVRLVHDRGHGSVDLRPTHAGAEWFDLALMLELVGDPDHASDAAVSFDQLVTALENQSGILTKACARSRWPVTQTRLRALEQARVRRLFPTLSREGD